MMASILSALVFLETYVVPIAFAIGVIVFIYGFILYSIIGIPSGDTDVVERGRKHILNACVVFILALILYGVIQGTIWAAENVSETKFFNGGGESGGYGAEVDRQRDWLETPNTPRREE